MSLLAVKHAAQKVWVWCKEHWKLCVAFIYALVVYIIFNRGNGSSSARQVMQIRTGAKTREINAIHKAHKEEKEQKEKLKKVFDNAMLELETTHNEKLTILDRNKKKRVKQLVQEHQDAPEELSKKLAEEFGIDDVS